MIKLLVVDDSAFMRMAIAKMIEAHSEIEIVGEARDGAAAVQMAQQLKPNVITMDVEMPVLSGIAAVEKIMATAPCPIIMVSSLTMKGADVTIKALQLGAVDFIAKSSSFVQLDIVNIEKELQKKILYWAKNPLTLSTKARLRNTASPSKVKTVPLANLRQPTTAMDLVVVGVSTGGPRAVLDLLKAMGKLNCPMVIAQHMPKEFTPGFAEHLARETGLSVVEGHHGMTLQAQQVVVAPGGTDSQICQPFSGHYALDVKNRSESRTALHPNVDLLFHSTAKVAKSPVALILTGMGDDGTRGASEFQRRDFPVLVQEPATCVVDGMPGAAIGAGVASEVLDLQQLGSRLSRWDSYKAGLNYDSNYASRQG